MLTVNSAWFVKDLLDYENRVIWLGSEKIDKVEFIEDQPFLVINMVVEYHITEELDGSVVFRIKSGEEIIHEAEPQKMEFPYEGNSKVISIPHTRHVPFRKPGLYTFDIIFRNQAHEDHVLKTIELTLT